MPIALAALKLILPFPNIFPEFDEQKSALLVWNSKSVVFKES